MKMILKPKQQKKKKEAKLTLQEETLQEELELRKQELEIQKEALRKAEEREIRAAERERKAEEREAKFMEFLTKQERDRQGHEQSMLDQQARLAESRAKKDKKCKLADKMEP